MSARLAIITAVSTFGVSAIGPQKKVADGAQGPGCIYLPVSLGIASPTRLTRRSGAPGSTILQNEVDADVVNITIGGQTTTVILDTGSFELWVNPSCSSAATGSTYDSKLCEAAGQYHPSASNTSITLDENFSAQYGKGSANGTYYSDTIDIGGISINGQHFAVANDSEGIPLGILGIGPDPYGGYNMSEPAVGKNLDTYMANPYSLLLTSMVSQGLINSRAFSLDMASLDNPTGSLIFGGVDKGRFQGTLQTFPLLAEHGSLLDIPIYRYVHHSNDLNSVLRSAIRRC